MGLDMFAHTRDTKPPKPTDFELNEDDNELFYWRKHPNLHGWMECLYRAKGGIDADFNCVPVEITLEDLDRLETATLPETQGFFFGVTTPEDLEKDKVFITKAREALNDGLFVYYSSWW